jgi:hypothetical protein
VAQQRNHGEADDIRISPADQISIIQRNLPCTDLNGVTVAVADSHSMRGCVVASQKKTLRMSRYTRDVMHERRLSLMGLLAGEACNQRHTLVAVLVLVSWRTTWPDASRCLRARGTLTRTHLGGYQRMASDQKPPVCYVVCCRTSKVWESSGRGDEGDIQ